MRKEINRRRFLQLGAGFGLLAGLGRLEVARATTPEDYKALVCIFLFGGNDGHNTLVPLETAQYNAYKTLRAGIALPPSKLLTIDTANHVPYALHYGLGPIHQLYFSGQMAVVANVGMLVQPTTRAQYLANSVPLPTQLFSHSDQIVQMQTGFPSTGGGTGWGGRVADTLQANNAGTTFPPTVSMGSQALFCAGNVVQSAALQQGNNLGQYAMSFYPPAAAAARAAGQQEILGLDSGATVVQAAKGVMANAVELNQILNSAAGVGPSTTFPQTAIGAQLAEVARIINIRSTLGLGRQIFFCSLGSFDTHSGQDYQQWSLLSELSAAMRAFYDATGEMGVTDRVTTFTLSDFGRTLQPSGTGCDHGWGSHHLVVGGAVQGGTVHGTFPTLALAGPDDANSRGVLIPTSSMAQYGATFARWFGATDAELDAIFPTLPNFPARTLGFMGP
jgi:uncharacterized protein (DUF1501 family)